MRGFRIFYGNNAQVFQRGGLSLSQPSAAATPVAAAARFFVVGLGFSDGEELVVGNKTYTFVEGNNTGDNIDFSAFADEENAAEQIGARINTDTATTLCTALAQGTQVDLTANTPGVAGNSIPLSTTAPPILIGNVFMGGSG